MIKGNFNFNVQKILNGDLIFDINKTKEEQIMDKIIEALPKDNHEFYIEYKAGTNVFTVRKKKLKKTMEDKKTSSLVHAKKNFLMNLKQTITVLYSLKKKSMIGFLKD